MSHSDFNIILNPNAFVESDGGEPPEPDWDQLITMLRAADDYMRGNDEACDMDGCIEITETCDLFLEMLTGEFSTSDDRLRAFVRHVEWSAFWLAGQADDDALGERIYRLCERQQEIAEGMRAASREFFGRDAEAA